MAVRPATVNDLPELLGWLKEEQDRTGEGFYCNRSVIEKCIAEGDGLCAVQMEGIVGFAVFQVLGECGALHIIETHPSARRQGIGSRLLQAAINVFRDRGLLYIEVECTSAEGEALCRAGGFEDYVDPRNYRSEHDDPMLRLYLTDWRPPARHPWA